MLQKGSEGELNRQKAKSRLSSDKNVSFSIAVLRTLIFLFMISGHMAFQKFTEWTSSFFVVSLELKSLRKYELLASHAFEMKSI